MFPWYTVDIPEIIVVWPQVYVNMEPNKVVNNKYTEPIIEWLHSTHWVQVDQASNWPFHKSKPLILFTSCTHHDHYKISTAFQPGIFIGYFSFLDFQFSVYRISSKYGTPSNYGTPLFLGPWNILCHKIHLMAVAIFIKNTILWSSPD